MKTDQERLTEALATNDAMQIWTPVMIAAYGAVFSAQQAIAAQKQAREDRARDNEMWDILLRKS